MDMGFKVGDIVRIKSGGPKMTVQKIVRSEGRNNSILFCDCVWFVNDCIGHSTFNPDAIVKEENLPE